MSANYFSQSHHTRMDGGYATSMQIPSTVDEEEYKLPPLKDIHFQEYCTYFTNLLLQMTVSEGDDVWFWRRNRTPSTECRADG